MNGQQFEMFSLAHFSAIGFIVFVIALLFLAREKWASPIKNKALLERIFAFTLLWFEIMYHLWMVSTGRWHLYESLPLELCSLTLLASILLLWTGNRHLFDFVFYAGIGGAIQAIVTPVLDLSFPHFRYFHFFYTHLGIILTALYFVWMKGYRPTCKGIWKTMLVLNILLPFITIINWAVDGNYMFLRMKPTNGSLLDFLGPYPWYILSLEVVAVLLFILLWLIVGKRSSR
ncbi:TIGR02206 family membrane protein [Sporosarcina sp. 179-K 3D1 HS]|uniref:YwaF family protein n=1 Tax=Sporosarcina sp. 179-K 3D1 HS TaxID=3232169 RepID=UPI0039A134FB